MPALFPPILFISIFIVVLIAVYAGQIRNVTEKIDTLSNEPEGTLHRRSYFYIVGSEYASVSAQNSVVSSGQMYVEHLVPIKVIQPFPIVFIPGNGMVTIVLLHSCSTLTYCHHHDIGMTGTNFLNTPDGRLGWADHFLSQGYEVTAHQPLYHIRVFHHFQLYIVDQPSRGRSAWQQGMDGPQNIFDTLTIEKRFTATQRFHLWPQASLLTQWLGNGSLGDDTFNKFYSSIVPGLVSNLEASEKMKHAGSALLDRVGVQYIIIFHRSRKKSKSHSVLCVHNSLLSFSLILKLGSMVGS
jgi:hypothetical protein